MQVKASPYKVVDSDTIIAAVAAAVLYDVPEGYAVKVVGDGLEKSLPYEKSGAFSCSRTFIRLKIKTGYGSKTALGSFQHITYGYIVGTSRKHITALVAAVSSQEACFIEQGNYLFEIFLGYALSVSNIFKRYIPLFMVERKVVEHSQSISAFC